MSKVTISSLKQNVYFSFHCNCNDSMKCKSATPQKGWIFSLWSHCKCDSDDHNLGLKWNWAQIFTRNYKESFKLVSQFCINQRRIAWGKKLLSCFGVRRVNQDITVVSVPSACFPQGNCGGVKVVTDIPGILFLGICSVVRKGLKLYLLDF